MTIETNKTKKTKSAKSKRPQTQVVGSVFKVYPSKRQGNLFYLWKESGGLRLSRITLHSEECWRSDIVLQRDECKWLLLQLQYQLRRKSVRIRDKTGRGKSQRVVCLKKSFGKMVGE